MESLSQESLMEWSWSGRWLITAFKYECIDKYNEVTIINTMMRNTILGVLGILRSHIYILVIAICH